MAVKTAEELKEQFAQGKYPSAEDYGDLIDTAVKSGSTLNVVERNSDDDRFYEGTEIQNLPHDSCVIVKNTSSSPIRLCYSYNNNYTVTVAVQGAVSFLTTTDSQELVLIGTPIR